MDKKRKGFIKTIVDVIIAITICGFFLFLWQLFANVTGIFIPKNRQPFYQLIQACIIIFCLIGVTYKKLWSPSIFRNRLKGIAFFCSLVIFVTACYHFLSVHKNAVAYYNYISSDNFISWGKSMYTKDDNLGYRMVPDNQTSLLYKYLPPVEVRTNANGYRIPFAKKNLTDLNKPVELLFLGCSFTFGSACKAEDSFPYLVANETKMNYVNAAVGGYGLAQMYVQAKQLISKYKPKYLIVQNSPWLIARGVIEFAPSRGGYMLPVPYFADSGNSFQIETPIYKSSIQGLFPAEDRRRFSGKFRSYYLQKGIPYFVKEQFQVFTVRCKNFLLKKKMPTSRVESAEFYAYREIFKHAEQHQTKVILLNLSNPEGSDKAELISRMGRNVLVANADSLLYKHIIGFSEDKYKRAFGHWGITEKGDSIFVDSHPNIISHKLIAQSISSLLK